MPAAPPTIDELEEHLRVFSLTLGVSLPEVKDRWAFLVQISHPDVVPEKLKDKASEEMIRINNAWEGVKSWFEANPDAKTTPQKEKSTAKDTADSKGDSEDDAFESDDDDWEAFEKKQRAKWSSQDGVSMAELDASRRNDLVVNERRFFILKTKVGTGILFFLGGFFCTGSGAASGTFDCWFVLLIAYLIWLFHPKAKQITEEWIQKG